MARSLWKGFFLKSYLLKKKPPQEHEPLKIWCRNSSIPFSLKDQMVLVHNGKDFKKMVITREKVGFKFGEFIGTRSSMNKVKKAKVLAKKK